MESSQSPFGSLSLSPTPGSPPASFVSLPVTPEQENYPTALGKPETEPPPTNINGRVSISIENPTTDKTKEVVVSSLYLREQEDKEDNTAVDKHAAILRARDSVTSQIKGESESGLIQSRVHLKATGTEMFNVQKRITAASGKAFSYPLLSFGASHNPVTKIVEATYMPYTALKNRLEIAIHWEKTTIDGLLERWEKEVISKIIDPKDKQVIQKAINRFKIQIEELIKHRNDPTYFKPKQPISQTQEDGYLSDEESVKTEGERIDLAKAFREKYVEIIKKLNISIQEYTIFEKRKKSSDPAIEFLKNDIKELQGIFKKGDIADKMLLAAKPLYKKEEVLSLLRNWISTIYVINADPDRLSTEAIQSIQKLQAPGFQGLTIPEKLEKIQVYQYNVVESLKELIKEVSQTPGSYIEKSVIDKYVNADGDNHLPETAYGFVKGEMKPLDLRNRLHLQFMQMTTYVSSIEALSSTDNLEDHKIELEMISEVISTAAKYVPLTKLENYFSLETQRHTKVEVTGVPLPVARNEHLKQLFAATPHYYSKDEIIQELRKASHKEKGDECSNAIAKIEKINDYFISQDDLVQILPKNAPWDILANLKAYVLPKDLMSLTELSGLQNEMNSAIQRVQAEQVFPKEFAFKIGKENKREQLMSKLLASLRPLGKFIVPKFELILGGASLKGKENPLGLASEWVKGKPVDQHKWQDYNRLRAKVIKDQYYARLLEKLEEAKKANNSTTIKSLERKLVLLKSLNEPGAKERKERLDQLKNELCVPASQYSILSIGVLDILFGSIDSHENQIIIDSNGNYYNVDYARYGLTFFVHYYGNEIFANLRSFSLDHPFSSEDLPPDLIKDIQQLDPNSIESEWSRSDLIGDEEFFIRHRIFQETSNMLRQLEKGNINFAGLNKATLETNVNSLKAKLATVKDEERPAIKNEIIKKESQIQLINEAKDAYIKAHEAIIKEQKKKRWITDEDDVAEIDSIDRIIRDENETIKKINEQETLEGLFDIDGGMMKKFLKDKSEREQEICFSKLSIPAMQQFKSNLTQLQNYLNEKGKKTLRDGAEVVYSFLKPFLTAVDRLEGEAFSKLTEKRVNNNSSYRSLADVISCSKASSQFFLEDEINSMAQVYNDLLANKIEGIKLGPSFENAIAW